jgi:hypothetical protein
VHEEGALAVEIDDGGIGQQRHRGLAGEALGDEEIAIAVHEKHRDGARGRGDRMGDAPGKRQREPIVAHPVFEEVAEDVEPVRPRRRLREETLELRDGRGSRFVEVQVRDEERAAG